MTTPGRDDSQDPLERIGALAKATPLDAGPRPSTIRRRSERRRRRRHAAVAGATAVALALVAVVAIDVPGDEDLAVGTADVPPAPETVPAFTRSAWEPWEIDGVVDRAGRAAPVYRRGGAGDGLVIVLGASIPCIDEATCAIARPGLPDDLGFLGAGSLADQPVVFVPSWNDDLHVGQATDVAVDGLDSPQQFVGARNVARVVRTLAAERADDPPDRIVVAGIGGGGIGAMVHARTVGDVFPSVPTVVVADGTLVPGRDTVADCLLEAAGASWGAAVPGERTGAAAIQQTLAEAAPAARFVVIVGRDGQQVRSHLPIAGGGCDPADQSEPTASYRRAVEAMDAESPNWRIVQIGDLRDSALDRPTDDGLTRQVLRAIESAWEEGT